jgi:hypothetical protein
VFGQTDMPFYASIQSRGISPEGERTANPVQTCHLEEVVVQGRQGGTKCPDIRGFFYFDCPMIDLFPSDRSEVYECFSDFFEEINTHRAQ